MRRLALTLLLALAGCGFIVEPPGPMGGRACAGDDDCVPNGCCGEATSVVHRLDAPGCGGQQCSGMCPATQVRCGCGVPLCRDARCTVAVATDPQCE